MNCQLDNFTSFKLVTKFTAFNSLKIVFIISIFFSFRLTFCCKTLIFFFKLSISVLASFLIICTIGQFLILSGEILVCLSQVDCCISCDSKRGDVFVSLSHVESAK